MIKVQISSEHVEITMKREKRKW